MLLSGIIKVSNLQTERGIQMTEHEELLMLRQLVQKQQLEIEKLNTQVENMLQALLHARKKIFGASSEATAPIQGQQNLFGTTQELAKELLTQQKEITVGSHKRKPRQPGVRAEMLDLLPKDIEEYIVNPEETCSVCGSKLKVVGKMKIQKIIFSKQLYRCRFFHTLL